MNTKEEKIICYKGFDKNLKCMGFQYKVGEIYKLPDGESPKVCEKGFHACPNPADLFNYYPPCYGNRFAIVELGGEIDDSKDDKLCASIIKIIKEVTPTELAQEHKKFVETHLKSYNKINNTGIQSSASNTGIQSSASNTGIQSSASNTGNYSSASNTGIQSSASNTGNYSSASNTGNYSSASNTGNYSSASNTGDYSSASNTGDYSSAEVSGIDSVAAVFGKDCRVKGTIGCALFLTERGYWNHETGSYPIINVLAVIVDGENVKADTWYTLEDGKLTEVLD